ncbi:MAG: DUF1573 domain-containing protein [Pirellula sp.]
MRQAFGVRYSVSWMGCCYLVLGWMLLMTCAGTEARGQAWAAKLFEETHHDFGTVSRNAKTEYAFVIENPFEEDIHIASVRSSCGCTTPVITKNTLKSWEKGQIIAQFNTRSFIGTKTAMITVVIDRPYYAEVQLTVGGTIRSDIVVEPGEVRFGDVEVGTSKSIDLKISYAGRRDWKLVDVRGNSDVLEVRLGEPARQANQVSYRMQIRLKDNVPAGDFMDEIIMVTDDPNERDNQFTLPVTARIRPPVTVTPEKIAIGDIHSGELRQYRVIVKSKKPFSIESIVCDDDRFEFTPSPGEKSAHVIPFTFKGMLSGDDKPASVHQRVRFITSLGEEVEATVTARLVQ